MKNTHMKGGVALSSLASALALMAHAAGPMPAGPVPAPTSVPKAPKTVELNLDKSIPIPLQKKIELKAQFFRTADSKEGWALQLPGARPIATPAYWNGMLFVGGGYGSYEFYALDAQTGKVIWQYHTGDDGPTAAVVENGLVAFNTESCTVYVLDAKTGKEIWKEYLGDPLMSQPAIYRDKLYMAYPAKGHHPRSQGVEYTHSLLCADLKTGKHIWTKPISADAISAPIANNGEVLLTCQDGTSFCFNADNGTKIWQKANSGTSAPLATKNGLIFTQKENRREGAYEGLAALTRKGTTQLDKQATLPEASRADYLKKGAPVAGIDKQSADALNASVGFQQAPTTANLGKSILPADNVLGGWAYQGSRVAAGGNGSLFYNNGASLQSAATDRARNWRAQFSGRGVDQNSQLFAPASVGKENLYLASANGHIVSVKQDSGQMEFNYSLGNPIAFQPALANGNIYVGTSNGIVMCLKTGAKDADGWTAWGGNAQHNKE